VELRDASKHKERREVDGREEEGIRELGRFLSTVCILYLWYSNLSGSSFRSLGPTSLALASVCRLWAGGRPRRQRTAGSTSSDRVTRQLTGLPGRPKNRHLGAGSEWGAEELGGLGIEAKVVGLPGFMLSRPK
jgi:hypothetical protein